MQDDLSMESILNLELEREVLSCGRPTKQICFVQQALWKCHADGHWIHPDSQ